MPHPIMNAPAAANTAPKTTPPFKRPTQSHVRLDAASIYAARRAHCEAYKRTDGGDDDVLNDAPDRGRPETVFTTGLAQSIYGKRKADAVATPDSEVLVEK